jgi:drug/metabolite transporter (DMT)-like permease
VPFDFETAALLVLTLVAFASNSLLTRLALGRGEIDAATFAALRIGSGAAVLVLLAKARGGAWSSLLRTGARGSLALFGYAAPFSFAYLRIDAAVGALVLFGVVQLAMIGWALNRGERPSGLTSTGIGLAVLGLGWLTVPAVTRPDPVGLALMAVAGVAWAVYTILGRSAPDPIAANAGSFLLSTPIAVLAWLVAGASTSASAHGIVLALVSGGVTSGLGYACWYRVLPRLSVTQAAVAQLAVPVIAALGAVGFLGEALGLRLVLSGVAILGGVGLVLWQRRLSSLGARPR